MSRRELRAQQPKTPFWKLIPWRRPSRAGILWSVAYIVWLASGVVLFTLVFRWDFWPAAAVVAMLPFAVVWWWRRASAVCG